MKQEKRECKIVRIDKVVSKLMIRLSKMTGMKNKEKLLNYANKFTKTLSTLLGSGVPIIPSLEITQNVINNKIISDVVAESKVTVQEGNSLGGVIERSHVFPPLVTHMIKTGEKTGELEQMLQHVSNAYDAEVERKIDSMISLIEPLMIIFMGGIVVIVVIAMMVPMLGVMGSVR